MQKSLSIMLAAAVLAAPPLLTVGPAVAADEPTRIALTRWTDNADFRTGTPARSRRRPSSPSRS